MKALPPLNMCTPVGLHLFRYRPTTTLTRRFLPTLASMYSLKIRLNVS